MLKEAVESGGSRLIRDGGMDGWALPTLWSLVFQHDSDHIYT